MEDVVRGRLDIGRGCLGWLGCMLDLAAMTLRVQEEDRMYERLCPGAGRG